VKITPKLTLVFVSLSLVPLALTSTLFGVVSTGTLTAQSLAQLDSVASVQKSRLEQITSQNLERLTLVTSRTQLRLTLENYTRDPKPEYQAKVNQILLDAKASVSSFRELHVLTLNGTIVASTNSTRIGANYSGDAVFVRGQLGNTADILYFDERSQLSLYLSGPLTFNNTLVGVMIIDSGVDTILSLVTEYTGLGLTGETQLAERDSNGDARFLTPTRFDPYAALNRTVPKADSNSPIIEALSGKEQIDTDAIDYRGQRVLAATRYLNETDWGLVVKIDEAEAFAPVAQLRNWLIVAGLLASVAIAGVSIYEARTITKPIRAVTDAANRISQGELSRRVEGSSNDEIGTLGRAVNQMAQGLIDSNAELERKVAERTSELSRSNAELEQFAYVASHDLQEPLRMVASYTQLLAKRYKGRLDADADEFISYASDGAIRMQTMINDLLSYSRVGTKGKDFAPTDTQVGLERALQNLQAAIQESGAVVTHNELPAVVGDDSQLVQVFQNLIGNAIKFRKGAAPHIHVSAERKADECIFSVRDDGIGIDPKHRDRLFVMFRRLHGSGEYPGTGIGLAICRKIVERHGGRIWFDSEPGKGSAFHFTIPSRGGG